MKKPRPFTQLGKTLRAARRARKWTQLTLAHHLGLRGQNAGAFVSRLENGKGSPSMETLRKLAKTLKTTEQTLLGGGERFKHIKGCGKGCPACLAALEWHKRPQHGRGK